MLKSISLLLVALATIPSVKTVKAVNANECLSSANEMNSFDDFMKVTYDRQEDIIAKEKSRHSDVRNISIKWDAVMMPTLSVNFMALVYNTRHQNDHVDNCCQQTAVAMAARFYIDSYNNSNLGPKIKVTKEDLFAQAIEYSRSQGWWNAKDGSIVNKGKFVLNHILESYGLKNSVWDNTTDIYQGVVDFTNASNFGKIGKVQLFGVFEHACVANGYLQLEYDYTNHYQILWNKWTKDVHVVKNYLIIADGFTQTVVYPEKTLECVDNAYEYFELGTMEQYVNGIDFPNGNYVD